MLQIWTPKMFEINFYMLANSWELACFKWMNCHNNAEQQTGREFHYEKFQIDLIFVYFHFFLLFKVFY